MTKNQVQSDVTLEGLEIRVENIRIRLRASSATEVIQVLGSLLFEHGYVKETFVQAVLDREAKFPTGLQTQALGFAIPHTDTEHVLKPAVAIATLEKPVAFKAMGTEEAEVQAELVIMLAISDPSAVVPVLRSVVSIAENEPTLLAIRNAETAEQVLELVCAHINATIERMRPKSPGDPIH
jgi:PTS system galactitol-specific IIA component